MSDPLPVLHTARLILRPQTEGDLDTLEAFLADPSVAPWWVQLPEDDVREDLRHDGRAFTIEEDGAIAGWLGVHEEPTTGYRHAALDIILGPGHQDRGLGPEALRAVIDWLVEWRGHHRITIDPAIANARAVRAYEKVGFREVGVMRAYELGPDGAWRDSLLMDLLVDELPSAAA